MNRGEWFGTVPGRVAFDPSISGSAARVYLVLVMFRNQDDDTCYPSNATLMRYTGLSRSTVIRALYELSEVGVILREDRFVQGRQTTSLTHLTDSKLYPGVSSATPSGVSSVTPRTDPVGTPSTPSVTDVSREAQA
jgi:DNA-binding transcriptional MocR family regulator